MSIHTFEPVRYYSALGTYDPVMTITSGDTVITTTLDASGRDALLTKRHVGVNPMTGPFYIADAEPGDTLRVRLDRITPNRRYGWTGTQLAPNVIDPEDNLALSPLPEWGERDGDWDVDAKAGTATLVEPATSIGRFAIPTRPMIGCFGVAPPGDQAISTATSSTHGGNMDYKGFVEGVNAFFPVAVPGALFFLGDGHATQGCGEVVGTGIEISMDVQFTVTLLKSKKIGWPRMENDTHIVTLGNARPLDQALQHATSELARWLQTDYELDVMGSHILMGQCIEYEIGNVFDPAYTVAAKMSKIFLAALGKV